MVRFNIDFKNIINNENTTLQRVFLFITDVEELSLDSIQTLLKVLLM